MSSLISRKFHCIASEIDGKDDCCSSDGLAIYEHEEDGNLWYDGYCYSCNQYFSFDNIKNSSLASEFGIAEGVVRERKTFQKTSQSVPLSKQEVIDFIKNTGYVSNGYRGIKDEYNRFYGHLTKLDKRGNVLARYYPETENSSVTGYKCRNHPKDFRYGKLGKTGVNSDLSGEVKFKNGGKYVLIVGGEEDKVAAFQMLRESQIERGNEEFEPIAVVSPTCGEPTCAKQVQKRFDFLNMFEIIVIGMDNDEVGKRVAEDIAQVLPKEKVKIATWTGKDPNQMLKDGKHKQFVRDFYAAKSVIESGIKDSSADFLLMVKEELRTPRITLPPYMHRMQTRMGGGIQRGRIVNLIGNTSCGKSTHSNNIAYHAMFQERVKPGVVSLEATIAQYSIDILSIHLKNNLVNMNMDDVINYIDTEEVRRLSDNLWYDEYGNPRWAILDERDGDIKMLERQMERLVKQFNCDFIIVDVLSDILRGVPLETQENHMKWQKNFIKSGATILNVLHTKKPPVDKDGKTRPVNEYDAIGSSSFVQSAAINIVIDRDKEAGGIEQDTTYVRMPKCRGGKTGECGKWYYDWKTREVYDFEDYFADKVVEDDSLLVSNEEYSVVEHLQETPSYEEYEGIVFDET